jgi:hypothetical protein
MKHLFGWSILALLGLATSGWAAGLCCNLGVHCVEPPAPDCPNCSCPCEHRLGLCMGSSKSTQKTIDTLCSGETCCARIKAAKKLGCRLFADFCRDPEVLNALVQALLSDPCWEVRREAAWSIAMQGARNEYGVVALYLASRLDHHFLVRDKAAEALDILLVCRRDCFKEVFAQADELITQIKRRGLYKPGCTTINLQELCATIGSPDAAPKVAETAVPQGPMPAGVPNPAAPAVALPVPVEVLPVPPTPGSPPVVAPGLN